MRNSASAVPSTAQHDQNEVVLSAAAAARVLDLCYTATSLVALMMSGPGPDAWRQRWRAPVEGYVSVIDLSDLELDRAAELMIANQHDFLNWFGSLGDAANLRLTGKMIEPLKAMRRTSLPTVDGQRTRREPIAMADEHAYVGQVRQSAASSHRNDVDRFKGSVPPERDRRLAGRVYLSQAHSSSR